MEFDQQAGRGHRRQKLGRSLQQRSARRASGGPGAWHATATAAAAAAARGEHQRGEKARRRASHLFHMVTLGLHHPGEVRWQPLITEISLRSAKMIMPPAGQLALAGGSRQTAGFVPAKMTFWWNSTI